MWTRTERENISIHIDAAIAEGIKQWPRSLQVENRLDPDGVVFVVLETVSIYFRDNTDLVVKIWRKLLSLMTALFQRHS